MKIKQSAFSLLELLLVSTLALIILNALFICYVSSKKMYALNEALSRMQENGRLATYWLRRDVSMAGYIGCPRLADVPLFENNFSTQTRLIGWYKEQSTLSYPLPTTVLKQTEKNSDILLIQEMDPEIFNVAHVTPQKIQLSETAPFEKNDLLLISDCGHAEIFRVLKSNQRTLIPETALSYTYNNDAQVGYWHRWVYYIRKTDRTDATGKPIDALYRRDLNASLNLPAELMEGVDTMRVLFVLSNNHIVTADHVDNWKNVRGVHIILLLDGLNVIQQREWGVVVSLREPI